MTVEAEAHLLNYYLRDHVDYILQGCLNVAPTILQPSGPLNCCLSSRELQLTKGPDHKNRPCPPSCDDVSTETQPSRTPPPRKAHKPCTKRTCPILSLPQSSYTPSPNITLLALHNRDAHSKPPVLLLGNQSSTPPGWSCSPVSRMRKTRCFTFS